MVTIHHESFPHIIDNIWRNLDFLDLRVALGVCKDWHNRAKMLLWHLSIEHQSDGRLHVRALDSASSVYFNTVPTQTSSPGRLWMKLMPVVQVLDLVGAENFSHAQEHVWLRRFVERIPLVRWYGTPPRAIDALNMDTLLFFQDLDGPPAPSITLRFTHFQPQHIVSTLRCTIDPLRLALYEHPDAVNLYGWDGYTDSITLILQDARPVPHPPALDGRVAVTDVISAYLNIVRCESAEILIVGLELFLPELVERQAFYARLADQFRDENEQSAQPWTDSDDEFSAYWRYFTHDEYRAHIGETRYELYTER